MSVLKLVWEVESWAAQTPPDLSKPLDHRGLIVSVFDSQIHGAHGAAQMPGLRPDSDMMVERGGFRGTRS